MAKQGSLQINDLTSETFEHFRELIQSETGIYLRDSKKILIANRLRKRLFELEIGTYEEYFDLLKSKRSRNDEMNHFVDAVSTNETYFYRGTEQFEALRNQILPLLFNSRSTVRIWSAGCSTGEEPYSILIAAKETAKTLNWAGRISVTATDINSSVLHAASNGLYTAKALRELPDSLRSVYFKVQPGGDYKIDETMTGKVVFRKHNLVHDDPPDGPFDVIFCRNVLMYFTRKTQESMVRRVFASSLTKDGYLFIGSSESFVGINVPFTYAHIGGCPIYIRQDGDTP